MTSSERRFVIFGLAVFAVVSLVFTTVAMIDVSSWVVYRDTVNGQMWAEGYRWEALVSEAFHAAGDVQVPLVECVVGIAFLYMLWRELYPTDSQASFQTDAPGPTKTVESTGTSTDQ